MAQPAGGMKPIVDRLLAEWGLTPQEELPGATCSTVLRVVDSEGRPAVLKVPRPDVEEADAGWAVEAFAGHGGVQPIRIDHPTGSLLMPCLGRNLAEAQMPEEERLELYCGIVLRLRETPFHENALPLDEWFADLAHRENALEREAWEEWLRLRDSSPEPALLHGDLHHFNILEAPHGWTVIDPKGLQGDPAYEISAYMRNPVRKLPSGEELIRLTRTRLRTFAERLPYDPRRLWGWSFVQTVSCAGSCEPGFEPWLDAADALWELRHEYR